MVTVYTVGHSTRALGEFVALLRHYRIEVLVDVRTFPRSRRFPHFNQAALEESLAGEGIDYLWLKELGGRRHGPPAEDSPNLGLSTPGFRNYADHMLSAEFQTALARLRETASRRRLALICAERLYWRCHRRLISDYLTAQGDTVLHIDSAARLLPHRLPPGAHTADGLLTYPGEKRLFGS